MCDCESRFSGRLSSRKYPFVYDSLYKSWRHSVRGDSTMVKYDPHNHQRYYESWKNRGCLLPELSTDIVEKLLNYLEDMEIGANVNPSSKKGARSYGRLRNLKAKLHTMFILLQEELGIEKINDLEKKELDLLKFFKKMRDGLLNCRRIKVKPLQAVGTYARVFKSFWHWYQRTQRKNGIDVRDITLDLDARDDKPSFNYFTIDDLRKLCNEATYDYKILMMFMFDSGIRSPTELMNVKVNDLEWDTRKNYYTLTIREETSKTFGRRIKLLLCSEMLKEYIEIKKMPPDQQIFKKMPQQVNQYIKKLGYRLLQFGTATERESGGKKYITVTKGLTMYDFRHSSACYWLPRYKSESAMKYRFGWKKSDMIHYYTELLGMKDTIDQDDLYLDISKTDLEKQIQEKGREIDILQEKLQEQDQRTKEILQILKAVNLDKIYQENLIVIQTPRE